MSVSNSINSSTELKRGALGVGFIIFFVVSAASPLSVIAGGFPIGIMLGNGAGTPALLILALLVLLAFSVGYTTMARHLTNAGGFYAFTARGLGGLAGGAAGVLAMFAYNILQVGLYGMFGGVVSGTMEAAFGLVLPWWSYSLMAMASIAILGYRKIDLSARVLSVMVIAEYLAILVLDFAILKSGGDSGINLDSFSSSQVFSGTPSIGLLFCFAAFIGFEATTIYGEEAKDPKRTIPMATYCSVLLIGGNGEDIISDWSYSDDPADTFKAAMDAFPDTEKLVQRALGAGLQAIEALHAIVAEADDEQDETHELAVQKIVAMGNIARKALES